jgi:DeoR family fructose operon transcriptional repressor
MTASMQQRRQATLAQAYQHGFVEVARLSKDLNVSEATVRRDLHNLAEEGLVRLTHGGATVVKGSDHSFISKSTRHVDSKKLVGHLAATMVADGDQIFIDSGTTCFEMIGPLRSKKGLSVIVNSIRTAQELYAPSLNVLLLGGQYRPDRLDTVGPMASASLERLRGYRPFIGSDGIGMDFGPTAIDIESASIFGQAVSNAKEAVLLVDQSKFDSPALYRIAKWDKVTTVVTETRPDDNWSDFFTKEGIKVVYPQDTE